MGARCARHLVTPHSLECDRWFLCPFAKGQTFWLAAKTSPLWSSSRYVIRGKWLYLEHNWVAEEGGYVFEPPGETHTLVVPDDCQDMITLFTVHGSLMYVDPEGNATGYDDVFTRIEKYRAHFESVGLGADYVKNFMR